LKELSEYFLTENPFPNNPIMDPSSQDPRINGAIFNSDIRQGELQELRDKLDAKLALVYLRAPIAVRGMGKSALVVHEWKKRQQINDITSIYVKVSPTATIADFTINIIRSWHEEGYLWNVLIDFLNKHIQGNESPAIPAEVVEDITASYPKMPPNINIGRYIYKGTVSSVLRKLAEWASNSNRALLPEVAEIFFETYLSRPSDFIAAYGNIKRKLKGRDEVDFFRSIIELTRLSRYKHHFIFLDQFEYAMTSKGKGKNIIEFCSDMRRLLEAGLGFVTFCVTMHLDASNLLGTPQCSPLTEIAPRGPRHVVDIRELNAEQACELALTYLEHFRGKRGKHKPPDSLYPFEKEAIEYVRDELSGNTRWILRALHFAIEEGREKGFEPISKSFILRNHESILQRAIAEKE
jgi:hypothetical protein